MVNRPKQIGTAGETAVRKIVTPYFPDAHRLVLAGHADEGDIWLSKRFILEVKAGAQTKQIGDKKLSAWMAEAQVEATNSGVDAGFLVVQRAGFGAPNAHRWWVYLTAGQLAWIITTRARALRRSARAPVRMELGHFLTLLDEQDLTEVDGDAVLTYAAIE